MRSILEVAKELNLSAEEFQELVNGGKLFGIKLDSDCLAKARKAFLEAARKPPTRH